MNSTQLDSAVLPDQFSTSQDTAVLCTLDNLCCYQVSGEDATDFLQGQFSNDIKEVNTEHAQLSAYCTPKGRMLASFIICQLAEGYLLITASDIASDVMKRLQMYVMRSKVNISELDTFSIYGLSNDESSSILNALEIAQANNDYETTSNDFITSIKIPGISDRYLLIGAREHFLNKEIFRSQKVSHYVHQYWQWLDILSGFPIITGSTQEAFVPQMVNMELIDGVSFSKGCYPGQEIVARLHYLGNANRRMFRVEVESNSTIQSGDSIYTPKSTQAIGKFLTVIKVAEDKYDALAVLRIEASKENNLTTAIENGGIVKIVDLPYEIPIATKE